MPYFELKDYQMALKFYRSLESVNEIKGDHNGEELQRKSEFWAELGKIHENLLNIEKAKECYVKAIGINKANQDAIIYLGRIYGDI